MCESIGAECEFSGSNRVNEELRGKKQGFNLKSGRVSWDSCRLLGVVTGEDGDSLAPEGSVNFPRREDYSLPLAVLNNSQVNQNHTGIRHRFNASNTILKTTSFIIYLTS